MGKSERIELLEEKVRQLEKRIIELEAPACTYYNGRVSSWQELARITDKARRVKSAGQRVRR